MAQWNLKLIAIAIMMMPRLSPAEQRTALAAAPSVRVIQPAHATTSINVTVTINVAAFNKFKFRVKFAAGLIYIHRMALSGAQCSDHRGAR
jgi:hypothetical protein